MMRKTFPPVAFATVCLACFICVLCTCAYLPPYPPEAKVTRSITELWEPVYKPDFAFELYQARSEPVGYTVGVIALDFSYDIMPRGEWVMTSLEEEYRKGFIDAFSESLKKILTAKGMDVIGPYASYDDITFNDRSRCDFIILPKLFVEFEPTRSTLIEELPDFGGPYGEPLIYGRSGDRLDARARLEYEIIDPRTREQLDCRSLKSDMAGKSYVQLWSRWTMTYGGNSRTGWHVLEYSRRKYPKYHNADNAMGKALEDLYHGFMPRIDGMVSAGEFELLEGRKREAKKRK